MKTRTIMNKMRIGIIAAVAMLAVYGFSTSQATVTGGDSDPKVGLNIGDKAPNIALPDMDGKKEIDLKQMRGKYVLIDFWASWCGPCRRENPNVVSAYEKYNKAKFKKGKGFAIYSVSLDRDRERWKAAVLKDNLTWSEHVSDLKHWASEAAQLYQIRGIPNNYLIDPDGVIVAKNLRGMNLHTELDKHVKSL